MLIARVLSEPVPPEASLRDLEAALGEAGQPLAGASMLDHCGEVLEIAIPSGTREVVAPLVEKHLAPSAALFARDVIEIPRLLVSDMDSTMIGQECIDELADFAGVKEQVAGITERAMRGELDFAGALKERVGLLEGLEESAIEQCLAERIVPTPGAATLIATLSAHGARTVLVTGGFHRFADPVAERLGFDRVVGNRLLVEDGKLTGTVQEPICDSATKKRTLREEAETLGEGARTLALGDGANDTPMLVAADYGIAYRAKPKTRAAANGWIDGEDLTAMLLLLGIDRERWVRR
ncbi:phosphoserine phosphatase SerB [Alteriqipengyuania lutimaris]|uniref:phosphoserine phosphatase SerB n=1 Tax=Alteriqipengyuania lutimaris TaxID=1538146 RepID=UPI00182AAC14|nr:phosphoserine phosphatase [Alteriqipengyuania lutimaris]